VEQVHSCVLHNFRSIKERQQNQPFRMISVLSFSMYLIRKYTDAKPAYPKQ